jgi:hypothetical protein
MDKIVLICAVGRSGSTTMQRIVNTIPNSNICGENYGALISLLKFYKEIKHTTINYVPGHLNPASYDKICKANVKPSWYNSYQFKEITEKVREMIVALFKNSETTTLWGFKEIRYNDGKIQYIKEFKELFPQTKVIIQIRENINVQCESGWFKNDKTSISFIKQTNHELSNFYKQNKDYCYFTTFERMFDKNNIKDIFKFIECEEYYNEDIISSILLNNLKD